MFRQIYLVSGSSLLIGFITGVFVYFQSAHIPLGQTATLVSGETSLWAHDFEELVVDVSGFEIIGSLYGGCERTGCASYRIRADGSYSYLSYTPTKAMTRANEVLSPQRFTMLDKFLAETDYEKVIETPFISECPVVYDGLGYRYEVRIGSVRYQFDSCQQELAGVPLFIFLKDQFEIFRVTHRSYQ